MAKKNVDGKVSRKELLAEIDELRQTAVRWSARALQAEAALEVAQSVIADGEVSNPEVAAAKERHPAAKPPPTYEEWRKRALRAEAAILDTWEDSGRRFATLVDALDNGELNRARKIVGEWSDHPSVPTYGEWRERARLAEKRNQHLLDRLVAMGVMKPEVEE